MRIALPLLLGACFAAAAHAAPPATFDCTPDPVRLHGLHMLYTVDTGQQTVHEFMKDDSGAPYMPDRRKFDFVEQTLPAEFDEMIVIWSIQSPRGAIYRTLDRTSSRLTINAPVPTNGTRRIVITHVACKKLVPRGQKTDLTGFLKPSRQQ